MATKNTKNAPDTKEAQMTAAAEQVRLILGLETLEDRKRDALDFHTFAVWQIREVIQIAFDAGFDAAHTDRTPRTAR